jgi:hypothetical protein
MGAPSARSRAARMSALPIPWPRRPGRTASVSIVRPSRTSAPRTTPPAAGRGSLAAPAELLVTIGDRPNLLAAVRAVLIALQQDHRGVSRPRECGKRAGIRTGTHVVEFERWRGHGGFVGERAAKRWRELRQRESEIPLRGIEQRKRSAFAGLMKLRFATLHQTPSRRRACTPRRRPCPG